MALDRHHYTINFIQIAKENEKKNQEKKKGETQSEPVRWSVGHELSLLYLIGRKKMFRARSQQLHISKPKSKMRE